MYGEGQAITKAKAEPMPARLMQAEVAGLQQAATRDPGVATEIKMLHAALENLGQRTEHLFQRMEGVMRPSAPTQPGGQVEAKEPNLSPLAREIALARHHAGRILNVVNEMHARLDA